jgi:hypothetical protein
MLKQVMIVVLCGALVSAGCASAAGPRVVQDSPAPVDRALLADYVQRIPPGSRVRVERTSGGTLRGTLLKAGADSIAVQRNTRVPEPPVDIPFGTITRITLDSGSSAARTVGVGIAAGVGATFGVLLLLAAIFSD